MIVQLQINNMKYNINKDIIVLNLVQQDIIYNLMKSNV